MSPSSQLPPVAPAFIASANARTATFAQLHQLIDEHAAAVGALAPAEHGYATFAPDFAHEQLEREEYKEAHQPGYASPTRHGDLAGWIIPAKDLSDVAGLATSNGSIHRRYRAATTDEFIASYTSRGALITGKTLAPELGLSAYTEPVGMEWPINPRFAGRRTPGGSSGGAAVMVARGLVRAAHASDGGGSIRVPAAACGLYGFKPAHNTSHANPVAQGFVAGTLADAYHLAAAIPGIGGVGALPLHGRPLRIAVVTAPVHAEVEVAEHMLVAVDAAALALSRAGHEVFDAHAPYGSSPFAAFSDILALRSAPIRGEASPLVDWLRERGRSISDIRKSEAVETFMSVAHRLIRGFEGADLVLSPTLAFDPPEIGYFSSMSPEEDFHAQTTWTPWATMFNMSGGAAMSIPVDVVDHDRVGVHLGAVAGSAADIFRAAITIDQLNH